MIVVLIVVVVLATVSFHLLARSVRAEWRGFVDGSLAEAEDRNGKVLAALGHIRSDMKVARDAAHLDAKEAITVLDTIVKDLTVVHTDLERFGQVVEVNGARKRGTQRMRLP